MNVGLFASAWISCGCATTVLPDGCVDVVWADDELIVAGPATRAVTVPGTPGEWPFGVRLRTAAAEAVLGLPADVLRDLDVPFTELYGPRPRDRVARATQTRPQAALQALVEELAALVVEPRPDTLVREAARRLARPEARLPQVARDLGIGERQLHRRFQRSVGYGPRTLSRVHRLQRLVANHERAPAASLAELSATAGYADQAHMNREVRALSSHTPRQLLATGVRPAGEKSESFKTCDRHRLKMTS